MAKVNATDGFSIKGWMVTDLHLSGGDLIAFAIVENFSQSQAGIYTGGASYLASWMGWTYKTAAGHLQNLVDAGLITEEKRLTSVGIQNAFRVSVKITEGVCKNYRRGSVKITEGVRKKLPTDNNIDSKIDINEILGEVSPKNPEQIPPKHFTPPTADDNKSRAQKFDFLAALTGIGVPDDIAADWMQVRKAAKAVNTKTAFEDIEREIRKSGHTAEECVRLAVVKNWRGFKASWMLNAESEEKKTLATARKSRIITPDNIAEHYGTI